MVGVHFNLACLCDTVVYKIVYFYNWTFFTMMICIYNNCRCVYPWLLPAPSFNSPRLKVFFFFPDSLSQIIFSSVVPLLFSPLIFSSSLLFQTLYFLNCCSLESAFFSLNFLVCPFFQPVACFCTQKLLV